TGTVYNLSGVSYEDIDEVIAPSGEIDTSLFADLNTTVGLEGSYLGQEITVNEYDTQRRVQASGVESIDADGNVYKISYTGGSDILDADDSGLAAWSDELSTLTGSIAYDEAGNTKESYNYTIYYNSDESIFSTDLTHSYNLYMNGRGLAGASVTESLDESLNVDSTQVKTGGRDYIADDGDITVGADGELVIAGTDPIIDLLLDAAVNAYMGYDRFSNLISSTTDSYSGDVWDGTIPASQVSTVYAASWASREYNAFQYGNDVAGAKGNALKTVNGSTDINGSLVYSLDFTVSDSDILVETAYDSYGNNIYSKTQNWVLVETDDVEGLTASDTFMVGSVQDTRNYYVDVADIDADYGNLGSLPVNSILAASGRASATKTESEVYAYDVDVAGYAWSKTTTDFSITYEWGADASKQTWAVESFVNDGTDVYSDAKEISLKVYQTLGKDNLGNETHGRTWSYSGGSALDADTSDADNITITGADLLGIEETVKDLDISGNIKNQAVINWDSDLNNWEIIATAGSSADAILIADAVEASLDTVAGLDTVNVSWGSLGLTGSGQSFNETKNVIENYVYTKSRVGGTTEDYSAASLVRNLSYYYNNQGLSGNSVTVNYDVSDFITVIDMELSVGGYSETTNPSTDEYRTIDRTSPLNEQALYDEYGNRLSDTRYTLSTDFSIADIETDIIYGAQTLAAYVDAEASVDTDDVYSTTTSFNVYTTQISRAKSQTDVSISEGSNYDATILYTRDISVTESYDGNGRIETQTSYNWTITDIPVAGSADDELTTSDILELTSKTVKGNVYEDSDTNADQIYSWGYVWGDDELTGTEHWQETTVSITSQIEYDGRGNQTKYFTEEYDIPSVLSEAAILADPTGQILALTSLVKSSYTVNGGFTNWGGVLTGTVYNLSGVSYEDIDEVIAPSGEIDTSLFADLNTTVGLEGSYLGQE
ncbi:MAG: hypothetical protein U0940_04640, partial [Nitrospirota bacterium]|nr:hypothetical protein [Nitrospirota bacterium]